MRKIRLLIADDHQIVREGLKILLESDQALEVVAEAENGEEAIANAQETRPNVVIMDIAMPVMNGKIATVKIRKSVPKAKVVVLSSYHDDDLVRQMVFAGATAFLVKQSCGEDLLKAVHAAMKGDSQFSPCIMHQFQHEKQREKITGRTGTDAIALTPREREVLELVAQGLSNKMIATEMDISIKTVEKHRDQVMKKLGIHETAGLTRYALEKGMIAATRAAAPQMS